MIRKIRRREDFMKEEESQIYRPRRISLILLRVPIEEIYLMENQIWFCMTIRGK